MYCFNFLNFGLGIAFYYHFYFEPSFSLYISFLSLFRDLMYLCIRVVNLLLLAPDDDPLRVETCSAFYIYINIYFFKCWRVRRSYCLYHLIKRSVQMSVIR
jgi:hypothetical protein